MNLYLPLVADHVVGQLWVPTFAAIRAPLFLPESLNSLVFESHFILWAVCIVLAFILTKVGGARRQPKVTQTGFSLILVTMLWMFAAYLIDTPAERLDHVHRQMLAAAKSKDVEGVKAYMLPSCHYGPINRDALIGAADASLKSFTIKSNTITHYESHLDANHADSNITVVVQLDAPAAGTYITNWQLEWMDDPGSDWRLARINDWKLNEQDMPAEAGFPKAP